MRTLKTKFGFSVFVTNDEYKLIKKIKANEKLEINSLEEYYQGVGESLVKRNMILEEDDCFIINKEYFK